MSRHPARLAALARLTATVARAEEARMAALALEERGLRERFAALNTARSTRARTRPADGDPALLAGADPAWHRWIDGRKMAINGEIAELRVKQAALREGLTRAIGRREVAEELVRRDRAVRRQARERRDQTS